MSVTDMTKYKNFMVVGMPRSGNHYLAHLVGINFFGRTTIPKKVVLHHLPNEAALEQPEGPFVTFYCYRSFEGFSKSFYNLRARFGMGDITLEDLRTRPLGELVPQGDKPKANYTFDDGDTCQQSTEIRLWYARSKRTLREHWQQHLRKWFSHAAKTPHVVVVNYESLLQAFHPTMLNIAACLGSTKVEFEDKLGRIGWYPPGQKWVRELKDKS